ncbi:hypothetical protein ACM26V_11665 [Salipaludibacillus sp. HK11]|uniref:hypothetical protein n=1 Tax=Salipaludibacillus sp. HK11 TaxID=3394320 RepID=UPI0039FB8B8F
MQKNKLIILLIGSTILIVLVIYMVMLESEQPNSNNSTESNITTSSDDSFDEEQQENSQENSGNFLNAESENELTDGNNEEINDTDEHEAREKAIETISNQNLNESVNELTQDTLYEHLVLYQNFRFMLNDEDEVTREEDIESNAEWIAIELKGWHDHASENYQFTYSKDQFLAFVEEENYLEDEDMITLVLYDELKKVNEDLYVRQLETHYLKPYIWNSVEDQVAAEFSDEVPDNDENRRSLLYSSLEQEIMTKLVEENPNFFDTE